MTWDLTAIGDLAADLVLVDPDAPPTPGREILVRAAGLSLGGATGILAAAAARLGLRVRLVGKVGDDPLGRFVIAELGRAGVDTGLVAVSRDDGTGVTVALAQSGERALLTYAGTIATLSAADVPPAALGQTRHVHISSYFLQTALQPDVPALLGRARWGGATTSLDTGDDPADRWASGVWEALGAVDLFLPNEREATRLTGLAHPGAALERLAERVPTVALKLGASGARLATPDGRRRSIDAYPVAAVDTTGAGDVFGAGYLSARLGGLPPEECLRRGAAAGALATTWPGGQGDGLTLAALERLIAEHPREVKDG
jgi:sugar/nucleoside kinase (ribokinase family)